MSPVRGIYNRLQDFSVLWREGRRRATSSLRPSSSIVGWSIQSGYSPWSYCIRQDWISMAKSGLCYSAENGYSHPRVRWNGCPYSRMDSVNMSCGEVQQQNMKRDDDEGLRLVVKDLYLSSKLIKRIKRRTSSSDQPHSNKPRPPMQNNPNRIEASKINFYSRTNSIQNTNYNLILVTNLLGHSDNRIDLGKRVLFQNLGVRHGNISTSHSLQGSIKVFECFR